MISILLPSRGRPALAKRCIDSLRETAVEDYEILVYIDNNDPKIDLYAWPTCERRNIRMFYGDPLRPAQAIRKLAEFAEGDFMMFLGDDHVFLTTGWDKSLKEVIPEDGIGASYPDEKGKGKNPVFTRKFYDLLEIDPRFQHFGPDTWIVEIAGKLDRLFYVPVVIEHRRKKNGFDLSDETYHWGREVTSEDKAVFQECTQKRTQIAEKIRCLMK